MLVGRKLLQAKLRDVDLSIRDLVEAGGSDWRDTESSGCLVGASYPAAP
jgi:hypothetical protein